MAYIYARRLLHPTSFVAALLAALQWRLLLLWLVLLLLPTAIVALPLWKALGGLLDHSVHAPAWADQFNPIMFGDVLGALRDNGDWLGGAALAGLLLAVLLAPLLSGMVVSCGRAGRALGFGHLLQSAVIEYGRMFRLMLWSLPVYAIAVGVASFGLVLADKHAERVVLESQADAGMHAALVVLAVLFVLAQAVMESARAAFIADVGLRSATRALGRGLLQLWRRPLDTLLCFVLVTGLGYAIALAFGVARLRTVASGPGGFLIALLFSQLAVAAIGWMRTARLFALAQVARTLAPSRHADPPPAP